MLVNKIGTHSHVALLERHHAQELFELTDRNRDRLREWLPWLDKTKTVADTQGFIDFSLQEFGNRKAMTLGIWHEGRLAGVVGLHVVNWPNRHTSIGYWVGEEYEGKGLVVGALRALLDHAFGSLDLNRVAIQCASRNLRSQAVARRLGFKHEGTLRQNEWLYDHFVDHEVFSMLASEWAAGDSDRS